MVKITLVQLVIWFFGTYSSYVYPEHVLESAAMHMRLDGLMALRCVNKKCHKKASVAIATEMLTGDGSLFFRYCDERTLHMRNPERYRVEMKLSRHMSAFVYECCILKFHISGAQDNIQLSRPEYETEYIQGSHGIDVRVNLWDVYQMTNEKAATKYIKQLIQQKREELFGGLNSNWHYLRWVADRCLRAVETHSGFNHWISHRRLILDGTYHISDAKESTMRTCFELWLYEYMDVFIWTVKKYGFAEEPIDCTLVILRSKWQTGVPLIERPKDYHYNGILGDALLFYAALPEYGRHMMLQLVVGDSVLESAFKTMMEQSDDWNKFFEKYS